MDVSMESLEPSPESGTELHEKLLLSEQQGPSSNQENTGSLMPPPLAPPAAIPMHFTQSLTGFTFISPSKEGEVPMEFSPGVKRYIEREGNKGCSKNHSISTRLRCAKLPVNNSIKRDESIASSSEMHPSEIFSKTPGSPSKEFKAMLDAIDVNESPSRADGDHPDGFLKRQDKISMRKCKSMEMRKRLFDMSNTPPNAFKPVFKRPATSGNDGQNCLLPKLVKRPKDLPLPCQETAPSKDSSEHERIKFAVDVLQSPDMIGDCSREHCLPVITGKHSDLKNISHETMAHLLNNGSEGKCDKFTVIDCRYPYEYEGGHIKGAINIYTEAETEKFLKKEMQETTSVKPQKHILIFHCEFSSQRGPGLLRCLRKLDRKENMHQYPLLTFPEMYVLHLGYKEFFQHHPHLCIPSAYIPMADESFVNDLKHFRAKAKSWCAGERNRPSKR